MLFRSASERVPGRVSFLGPLNDVVPAYRAADVLVLASKGGDSMPAVLIEAGLCGLPLVACPVGAIEDVVVNGVTGLLVPSGDVPELTQALASLAADGALRRRLGDAAAEHCAARFTIRAVADRWEAVLRSVARPR